MEPNIRIHLVILISIIAYLVATGTLEVYCVAIWLNNSQADK